MIPSLKNLYEKQRGERERGLKTKPFDRFKQIYDKVGSNYKDAPYYMVHYSDVEKLGLNPSSDYNTPLGIYAYPIVFFSLDQFYKGDLPFASDRKYMHIFVVKPQWRDKVLIVSSTAEVDKDSRITKQELLKRNEKIFSQQDSIYRDDPSVRDMWNDIEEESYFQTVPGVVWNITRDFFAQKNPRQWSQYLMKLYDIYGVIDQGSGMIHQNEPIQAVFFRKDMLGHIATIPNSALKATTYLSHVYLNEFNTVIARFVINPKKYGLSDEDGRKIYKVSKQIDNRGGQGIDFLNYKKNISSSEWENWKIAMRAAAQNKRRLGIKGWIDNVFRAFYAADKY